MTATAAESPHRYQRWSGQLSSGRCTWLTVATTGIRLAFKGRPARSFTLLSLGFVVGTSVIFYLLYLLEDLVGTPEAQSVCEFVNAFLRVDLSGVSRIADYRDVLWRSTFAVAIRLQLIAVLLIAAWVGPGLIADDLKARALPIYFAKPLQPVTYIAGKWSVAAAFIGLVTLAPNLLSLIIGTVTTGGLATFGETLVLGWELLVSGVALMVIGGMLIVALSSLTSDKRYAAMGWLAICLLSMTTQSIVSDALPDGKTTGFLGSISLSRDFTIVNEWLFDLRGAWAATSLPTKAFDGALGADVRPVCAGTVLLGVVLVSATVCYWRVVRFSRAAANI